MKFAAFAAFLGLAASTSAYATARIGESCTGTETLQMGEQPPEVVPYSITFSADLAARTYCYDKCGPDRSYEINEVTPTLIKLANLDHGGQKRLMIFDQQSAILTDYQVFDAPLVGKVVRNAKATCRPVAFHEPAPPASIPIH